MTRAPVPSTGPSARRSAPRARTNRTTTIVRTTITSASASTLTMLRTSVWAVSLVVTAIVLVQSSQSGSGCRSTRSWARLPTKTRA